jgi:hypothetical protein
MIERHLGQKRFNLFSFTSFRYPYEPAADPVSGLPR